jgi:intein/homing endonuclease
MKKEGISKTTRKKTEYLWLNIPDDNMKKQLIIRVDLINDSFLRKILSQLKSERKKIKQLMNDDPNNKALYSQQWAIKVIMNAIYGYEGLATSTWGDLPVACAVVGICRFLIMETEKYLGNIMIECDSVTGNTPICVLRDNKYIDFVPIEELVPGGYRHKKSIRYYRIPKNIKVLTRSGWKKINYVKQHLTDKKIYRVNTTDGYVEVTEDHSLFTKDQREIKPVDLVKGSEIELISIPCSAANIKEFTGDFAWVLGLIAAEGSITINDGSISRARYSLSVTNQNKGLLDKCKCVLEDHYQINCNIYDTRESSATYRLSKDDKYMVSDLYHLCYTKGGQKKVPLFVLNGTETIKRAFLSGIWAGDGHISITKKQHIESIDLSDHTLAAGVKYLINSMGIKTGIIIRKDKPKSLGIKKRIPRTRHVSVNENLVKKVEILNADGKEAWVYDISTECGTFVTSIGGIVLHNTDGIAIKGSIDIDKLNDHISKIILDRFGVKSDMGIELEEVGEAFFYRMKNYITRSKEGLITRKGVVFKSSRHSRIYDKVLNKVIDAYMNRCNDEQLWEIIKDVKNMDQYTDTDFIMSASLRQEIEEYGNPMQMQATLGRQAEEMLGLDIGKGDSIDYIVTKNKNYTLASLVKDRKQIDLEYYRDDIDKILSVFGIKKIDQMTMFPIR